MTAEEAQPCGGGGGGWWGWGGGGGGGVVGRGGGGGGVGGWGYALARRRAPGDDANQHSGRWRHEAHLQRQRALALRA